MKIYEAIEEVYGLPWDRKTSSQIINQLERMAQKGIRFTVREVVDLYFSPENDDQQWVASYLVSVWMQALKKRFFKRGILFVSLNKKRQWGFPSTKEEIIFWYERSLRLILGYLESLMRVEKIYKRDFEEELKMN